MFEKYKGFNLQLFAEGGTGDGGAGDGAAAPTGVTGQADAAPVYPTRARRNQLSGTQYGAQPTAPKQGAQTTQDAAANAQDQAAARRPFDELVKGEYKADFDAHVQKIVQNRLKASKGAEETLGKLSPVLQMIGEKYGIDAADISKIDLDALTQKVTDDNAWYEEQAAREGIPTETFKKYKQLERDQQRMNAERAQASEQEAMRTEYTGLLNAANAYKVTNPAFDLNTEMSNPVFARMVLQPPRGSGVPLEAAYYALHYKDEQNRIQAQQQAAVQQAAQQSVQMATQAIASGNRRPTENGIGNNAAVTTKADPSQLKRKDFEEIKRRLGKGEQIAY